MSGRGWLKIAAPLSLMLLWQIAVWTQFLNPGLFPPPSAILANFIALRGERRARDERVVDALAAAGRPA